MPGITHEQFAATWKDCRGSPQSVFEALRAKGVVSAIRSVYLMRDRAEAALSIELPSLKRSLRTAPTPPPAAFERHELPELESIDELLQRRKEAFRRKKNYHDARALIPVHVKLDGPIGILHMGDPHVDDDGCDWETLGHHVDLANRTPGLLAGNVGDYTNNWVGRLGRLYGQQGSTAAEGWKLAEWLVGSVPWLYLLGGNHDAWSGDGDPIKWIARQAGVDYDMHGARLDLHLPNGRHVRVNGRHDFMGHSQWNAAHGPGKAAQMGPDDHIFVCGHKHTFGMGWHKRPSGIWSLGLRVGTYKHYDGYAAEKGFPDHNLPAVVTVIFPDAPDEAGFIELIKDVDQAADYLTWARARHASGRSVRGRKAA